MPPACPGESHVGCYYRADEAASDATGSPRGGSRLLLAPEADSKEREPPPREAVASTKVYARRFSGEREPPPRKAVASTKVDVRRFSGERESPPDKPGASTAVFTQPR